jgi:hypothetical protein
LISTDSGGSAPVGISNRESFFVPVRDLAQRYTIIQNGSDGAHDPVVRRHRFG